MKSSAIHKSVCFKKEKEKKVQTYNTYIQYKIKMINTYCAISEPVQFQGCNSLKKAVPEVSTHTLNNIPSALFRKKTGFQVKGFLQQELWC